jgi:alkylation response protein AidB-like acyl-CoA dehydrogenase
MSTTRTTLNPPGLLDQAVHPAVEALRVGGTDAILAAARSVAPVLARRADEYDQRGVYPVESIAALWSTGLWALSIPAARGGIGASLVDSAAVLELIGAADASVALLLMWHLSQLRMSNAYWPEHWWRRLNADAHLGPVCNALRVEPELGTPGRGGVPATTAHRTTDADGQPAWRINGHKIFSTASDGLRWMGVWGATAADDPDGLQVGTFLIPGNAPGVEIVPGSWNHLGMRASASNDVVFHDVIVPLDHAVGLTPFTGVDPAFNRPDPEGAAAWIGVLEVSLYIGVMTAARDFFVRYLNERVPTNLGAPLASLERFQLAVGEIEVLIYGNRQLIGSIAERADRLGRDPAASLVNRSEAGFVKVLTSRNAIAATELAVSMIGNPGLTVHNPLQRHFRDALCSRAHAPQADMVLGVTGRAALDQWQKGQRG